MSLVDFAHCDQNPRRVYRNSSEKLSIQKQRTLMDSVQLTLSVVPTPSQEGCIRVGFRKCKLATPTSLHSSSHWHQQGMEEGWRIPMALRGSQRAAVSCGPMC